MNIKKGDVLGQYYKLTDKIGQGSFGQIWKCINMRDMKEVAIKIENAKSKHKQLHSECKIYLWFQQESKNGDPEGIPKAYYFGIENKKHFMVMDNLGLSLEKLFNSCDRKFGLKTVLMLAKQMIERIEFTHSNDLIHRDIKPDNFVMGSGPTADRVYVIDFGLAKRYQTSQGDHIPYIDGKALTGTPRYVSINTHDGIEQSRRDDLESLCYVFIYLAKGRLPWQNLEAKSNIDKYSAIKDKKKEIPEEELCEELPGEFAEMVKYCRSLKFQESPDYSHIYDLIDSMMTSNRFKFDYVYDWTLKEQQR